MGAKPGGEYPAAGDGLTLWQAELVERIRWLINLRWLAFAGVAATILISRMIFPSSLPWNWLLATACAIPVYNAICLLAWRAASRRGAEHIERISAQLANAQILLDVLVLGLLIHFSGGVENLFSFYFVFHMVIAGTLLSKRAAFLQATFAVLVFLAVAIGEYSGFLAHYVSPIGIPNPTLHSNGIYVFAAAWVLVTCLYVTVYFVTSIEARLRWREDLVMLLSRKNARDADELRVAYEALARLEKAKSGYTRKVAHELRSPLAAIDGLLRTITDGLKGKISEEAAETLTRARYRVRELLRVAADLLALAAAREAKHLSEWSDVDLGSAVGNVIQLLAPQAEARGIAVKTNLSADLPLAQGDSKGIEELLANLLGNAIRYSPEGSAVELGVQSRDDSVEISVADHGIGIEEADQPRIFEEFYRAGSAKSFAPDGTGLGLAIVKSVVDAHGGTIAFTTHTGQGTTFTVRLPRRQSS